MQRLLRAPFRVPKLTRAMGGGGGHGHAAPQYTGIEATVRQYFPGNHHIVYLIMGGYATLFTLSQIRGSFTSAAAVAALPPPEVPDYHTIKKVYGTPSFGTPEWEEFVKADEGNFQVWLESPSEQ